MIVLADIELVFNYLYGIVFTIGFGFTKRVVIRSMTLFKNPILKIFLQNTANKMTQT